MTAYRVFVYDDSCHLYTSDDNGTSWVESHQNTETIGDTWPDLQMATVDADYATMVSFDQDFLLNTHNSRVAISTDSGVSGSWTVINAGTTDPTNENWSTGAVSANGSTILTFDWLHNKAPRITRDGGGTWANVTGLALTRRYIATCFSAALARMYIVSNDDISGNLLFSISIDAGVVWNDEAGFPTISGYNGQEGGQRLRCSANGATILYVDIQANVCISKDSGVTWTVLNNALDSPTSPVFPINEIFGASIADCGVSSDGNVLVVGFGNVSATGYALKSLAFISVDGGTTWSTITTDTITANYFLYACNVSPDAQTVAIAYSNGLILQTIYKVDISLDLATTWIYSTVPVVTTGLSWVAIYMIPIIAPAPAEAEVHRQIRDPWDCDEWGRFQPGVCIRKIF